VLKERDFIYRRPFVCVCTLINENVLILNEARRHMHSNVMSQIQFYDTTSTSTSTTPHHFWTTKTRHNRKATIKLHITSGQHRWDKWLAGSSEGRRQWRWRRHTRCAYELLLYFVYLLCSWLVMDTGHGYRSVWDGDGCENFAPWRSRTHLGGWRVCDVFGPEWHVSVLNSKLTSTSQTRRRGQDDEGLLCPPP